MSDKKFYNGSQMDNISVLDIAYALQLREYELERVLTIEEIASMREQYAKTLGYVLDNINMIVKHQGNNVVRITVQYDDNTETFWEVVKD